MPTEVTIERHAPVEESPRATVIGDLVVPVATVDHGWFQAGDGDTVDPESSIAREAAIIATAEEALRREEFEQERRGRVRARLRRLFGMFRRRRPVPDGDAPSGPVRRDESGTFEGNPSRRRQQREHHQGE